MIKSVLWNLFLMLAGSLVCAVGIKGILIPNEFLAGGITGLAILIHYLLPSVPIGLLYFALNIPLFAIGWIFVGRRFLIYSLAGVVIFSGVMFLPYPVLAIQDNILKALSAGLIIGVGSGIVLRSLGSAGGLDILSVILFKKYSIRPGTTVMAFNGLLIAGAAFQVSIDSILYTLVYLFVTSYSVDLVVTGLNKRKAVMVISQKWQDIAREILDKLQRGVTVVKGEGGFSGQEVRILYSVVTFIELSRFKSIIRSVDPDAFVVVTETLEVMGKRIGNQPHW